MTLAADRSAGARWAWCLLLILGLHAGAVLLAGRQLHPIPWTPPAEAIMLDLAPEAAPAVMPPAPLASVAPPSLAEVAPPDLATSVGPPELASAAPEPEALPDPPPLQPAAVEQPTPAPPRHHASRPRKPALTRRAMAPPPVPAPAPQETVVSVAREPAAAAAPRPEQEAIASWRGQLIARLQAAKRYPERARNRGDQGVALATFTMDRAGRVVSASLARSSGSVLLDEEAVAMIHRAEPLPTPPADVQGTTLTVTVPVSFALR